MSKNGCWVLSQRHFSKGDFPSDNFPNSNFSNVQFLKQQLLKRLGLALEAPQAAIWGPNAAVTTCWGPSAAARTDLYLTSKNVTLFPAT